MEQNSQKLHMKLLQIQSMVDAFTKSGQGQNYRYTTGNEVLNAIRPLMNDLGLLLIQEVVSMTNERMDYTTGSGKSKSEIFTSATLRFTWIDCHTGEKMECLFAANGMNDWDKGLGSALTYAERYFLLKFFHVPTDADDPDASQRQAAAPPKPFISENQFTKLIERVKGGDKDAFTKAKITYRFTQDQSSQLEAAAK